MRVLIMGCGRVGALVATALLEEGHQVRVMDPSAESFLRIPARYRETVSFQGDGTREEDLRHAGIEEADVFLAVSSRDTPNALAAQIAQHIFGVSRVICRINDPARQEMYTALGLQAVSPIKFLTDSILEAIHR